MKKISNKVLVLLILLVTILAIFPKLFLSVFATDVLYGDCNLDGKINNKDIVLLQKYIKGIVKFNEKQLKNADLDNSGNVDVADMSIFYKILVLADEVQLPVKYGDVDNNGVIDIEDVEILSQYTEGAKEFTEQQKICADMNLDDNIDNYDLEILKQYIEEYGSDNGANIKAVIYGDANCDGKINNRDLVLLQQYLNDIQEISFNGQLRADLNLDQIVNDIDMDILTLYLTEDVKKLPIVCGDINFDGKINNRDLALMMRHLAKQELLTKEQLLASDLNAEGTVNNIDYEIFRKHLTKWEEFEKLPFLGDIDIEGDDITIFILYGDANCDSIVNSEDVAIIENNQDLITDEGTINADVNFDGKINFIDANLVNLYVEEKITLPVKYGDINKDDVVNEEDINLINQHIEGTKEFTDQQKICADVNADGIVNYYDTTLLSKYSEENMNLPFIMGDVNLDGTINNRDLVLYQQYYFNMINFSKEQKYVADLNSDGTINDVDTQILKKYINTVIDILPIIYGDVDGNGKVDNRDEQIMKDYINKNCTFDKQQLLAADVNIDGKINNRDLGLVQRCLNGLVSLPQTFIENETITKKTIGNTDILKGFNIDEDGIEASEVMTKFTDNVEVIVYNEKQQEIQNDATVGTGDIVEGYYDVNEFPNQEYVIVIYGDTNGDGLISPLDALAIIKNKNNKVLFLNEFCEEAGRILSENGKETPSAIDALAIIKHLNGKYTIDQSK